jgi:hypothetical protein
MTEKPKANWEGTPLQMKYEGIYPYGISEIVIEFDTRDKTVLRSRIRKEFRSYELHQAATYIDTLADTLSR